MRITIDKEKSWRHAAVLEVTAILIALAIAAYLLHFRYVPPGVPPDIDQEAQRKLILERSGWVLPPHAFIVATNDGAPRTGSTFYYRWSIYSDRLIIIPHKNPTHRMVAGPNLILEVVEDDFWPRKIFEPSYHSYHDWSTGDIDVRVHSVRGKYGHYLSMETFERRGD